MTVTLSKSFQKQIPLLTRKREIERRPFVYFRFGPRSASVTANDTTHDSRPAVEIN